MKQLRLCAALVTFAWLSAAMFAGPQPIAPVDSDGKPLNLNFERGTLEDWDAVGSAFDNQPVHGDHVKVRYPEQTSGQEGEFWIGTYEVSGDRPQGTMTSVSFKVTHPFASFLIGGGAHPTTRVELVTADDRNVFFKTSAFNAEGMRPVVVDLHALRDKKIFIRLIDEESGGWGHINFDRFVFYDERIGFANEFTPPDTQKPEAALTTPVAASQYVLTPAIRQHWEKLGGTNCFFLVAPIGPEAITPDGLGRFCRFKEGGSIYWTTNFGAWSIHGYIRDKWISLNAEAGVLGYPVTDESGGADGVGRYNHFKNPRLHDQSGSIYFSPATGAHEVHGPILEKYMSRGAERSSLGYPTSDQYLMDDGTGAFRNDFQHGTITLNPASGFVTIP